MFLWSLPWSPKSTLIFRNIEANSYSKILHSDSRVKIAQGSNFFVSRMWEIRLCSSRRYLDLAGQTLSDWHVSESAEWNQELRAPSPAMENQLFKQISNLGLFMLESTIRHICSCWCQIWCSHSPSPKQIMFKTKVKRICTAHKKTITYVICVHSAYKLLKVDRALGWSVDGVASIQISVNPLETELGTVVWSMFDLCPARIFFKERSAAAAEGLLHKTHQLLNGQTSDPRQQQLRRRLRRQRTFAQLLQRRTSRKYTVAPNLHVNPVVEKLEVPEGPCGLSEGAPLIGTL